MEVRPLLKTGGPFGRIRPTARRDYRADKMICTNTTCRKYRFGKSEQFGAVQGRATEGSEIRLQVGVSSREGITGRFVWERKGSRDGLNEIETKTNWKSANKGQCNRWEKSAT